MANENVDPKIALSHMFEQWAATIPMMQPSIAAPAAHGIVKANMTGHHAAIIGEKTRQSSSES